jgi:hypothetical protein
MTEKEPEVVFVAEAMYVRYAEYKALSLQRNRLREELRRLQKIVGEEDVETIENVLQETQR